uniref:Uncharacterized protein n=1 Tax=Sphaerodactylus townsendi TaxID=933632 RepID=A0ACB8GFG3_9SAUR
MLPTFCSQKGYVAALLHFLLLDVTFGGKLLVAPMDGSHWLSMQSVLNKLKQNGHEIVVVAPEVNIHIKPSNDLYTLTTYPVPFTQEELDEQFRGNANGIFDDLSFIVRFVTTYNRMKTVSAMLFSTCKSLLYNQELMEYLEQSKFDAVFTDPMMPCGQIVAEHLGVPSVFFLRGIPCGLDSEALLCPSPPSYVPRLFTTNTDRMTFAQRVKNLLFLISESFLCGFAYSPYSNLAAEFLQKDMTLTELLSHGSVWLMRMDFLFDYPKPIMPNMIAIGGINCAGNKSLTQKGYVAALLQFLLLDVTFGGKLLVAPMDGSHWLSMQSVLNKLKQNGHEIVVVAPEVNIHIKPSNDLYTMTTYPVPFTKEELDQQFQGDANGLFDDFSFIVRFVTNFNRVKKTFAMMFSTCPSLLYNQELMEYLEQSKFDAVFTDPMMPCGQIVAEHLAVPSIFFLRAIPCGLDSEALLCPSPPSYVPRIFTKNTDRMTFAQRMKNLLFLLSESFLCGFLYIPYSNLAAEFLQKDMTLTELLSHGSVWLMRMDFVFDYPKPIMPNMIAIGGINCAGNKSLTQLLVVPMDGSHWLSMQSVLNKLKQNGHEIVVVAPEINMHIKPLDDVYTMKTYPVPFTKEELEEAFRSAVIGMFEELPFLVRFVKTYRRVKNTSALLFSTCTSLLYNQELMEYLKQSKFDAVFTDPMMPCGQIVAEYIGKIPSVFFLRTIPCGLDSKALLCPSPPSYVPRPLTTNTDRMTFAQRVKNLLFLMSESFLCGIVYSPYSYLAAEFLQKDMTLTKLVGHGSVWLMRMDFVFDYPKPIMPNMIAIGGINCAGNKSLIQVGNASYFL